MFTRKPYEFLDVECGVKVVLYRPAEIVRCSLDELYEQLRAYSNTGSGWQSEGHSLFAVFDRVDPRSSRHIREVVSGAFSPRSASDTWKHW